MKMVYRMTFLNSAWKIQYSYLPIKTITVNTPIPGTDGLCTTNNYDVVDHDASMFWQDVLGATGTDAIELLKNSTTMNGKKLKFSMPLEERDTWESI